MGKDEMQQQSLYFLTLRCLYALILSFIDNNYDKIMKPNIRFFALDKNNNYVYLIFQTYSIVPKQNK